jgi:two-component system C4-dicarboxylate transport sensor histidine kinase DctB
MDDHTNSRPAAINLGTLDGVNPDRLGELERFAEIGRLSAVLLHEINNPLTAAMLWLEQCNGQQSPHIRYARSSVRLMHRYVEAARQQLRFENRYRNFCVQAELDQAGHVLEALAKRRGIRLSFAPAGGCKLYGDPVKFQQIIANLVRNAIDAYDNCPPSRGHKPVRLDLRVCQDYLVIKVADKGCGMSGDQLRRLFEPFYSTKRRGGQGLGLGLFAVKRFIEKDFRGTISVTSSKRRGTTFTVRFRLVPRQG